MRRILALIAFSAIIGVAALPAADAASTRASTYRYTATGTAMPGGAIVSAADSLSGANFTGVRHVPRSNRLTVTVDDLGALDGHFVTLLLKQDGHTLFRDCMQVRQPRTFTVKADRPMWLIVESLPLCATGPCNMPLVDARVRPGENPVGAGPEHRIRSTVPVCTGGPPWSTGTAGTLTVSG